MGGFHGKLVIGSLLDDPGVDHLRHEVGGHLASFIVLLQRHHLLLQLMDLLDPGLILRLLLRCGFLVGLYLGESASPLA